MRGERRAGMQCEEPCMVSRVTWLERRSGPVCVNVCVEAVQCSAMLPCPARKAFVVCGNVRVDALLCPCRAMLSGRRLCGRNAMQCSVILAEGGCLCGRNATQCNIGRRKVFVLMSV